MCELVIWEGIELEELGLPLIKVYYLISLIILTNTLKMHKFLHLNLLYRTLRSISIERYLFSFSYSVSHV